MARIYHNIGILAHVDAGKTTLTEQLLYLMGVLRSAGSVDDGTTATDSLAVERRRGISVRTATASAQWKGVTVNLVDTPGHVDFAGEVERSLTALDHAVVVVSAVEGVRAHTENILRALGEEKLPYSVFVNKTDRAGAELDPVLADLARVAPEKIFLPLSALSGMATDTVTVSTLAGDAFDARVTEALADTDDEAADAFLSDTALPHGIAEEKVRAGIAEGRIVPVLAGSAKLGVGIEALADFLVAFMPSSERRATEELSGIIFKIEHDRAMGKISHVRLFGGRIV
ncbi:MAG: GTP-binding protein, partial [Clostridia bacterium]|nr:GTP-binding protein [Clostridia bacterium]